MKYSVLISTYNPNPILFKRALLSVVQQSMRASEIIIIDDCSDNVSVADLVDNMNLGGKVKLYRNNENLGLAGALKAGMFFVSNDIVARIDDDDIWLPFHAKRSCEFLSKHPKFSLTSSAAINYSLADDVSGMLHDHETPTGGKTIKVMDLIWDNPIIHSTVFFKKDVYDISGGYRSKFRWEDYDLWVRFLDKNLGYIFSSPSVLYCKRDDSISRVVAFEAMSERLLISSGALLKVLRGSNNNNLFSKIFALFIHFILIIKVSIKK